jgi:hypothetical protein
MAQIAADVSVLDSLEICVYLRPSVENPLCSLCFLLFNVWMRQFTLTPSLSQRARESLVCYNANGRAPQRAQSEWCGAG